VAAEPQAGRVEPGKKMTMLGSIGMMSLRTRLGVLAAFALLSLLVALLVAWRLGRATESFALRQADSSLRVAAGDLARALEAHPAGYQTIEEAASDLPARPRDRGRAERPLPPHVKTLFAAYRDPLSRLAAITLHRFADAAGGFYRATDGALLGQSHTGGGAAMSADEADAVRSLAKQADETGAPAARTLQTGSERAVVVAYPARADGAGDVSAVWVVQRLSNLAGVSDRFNLAALTLLILSIVGVGGLALATVRDLRSGVSGIEQGLTGLTSDLGRRIAPPGTPELARITGAINQLADTLRVNLARQSELERSLRRSERLSALGRLTAGVAHEVRNPLAAIKLKVQMARRARNAPEKLDDTFRVITEEIERLDGLVGRLLEFGRTEPPEQSSLDLRELAEGRAAFFRDVAGRTGVKIEVRAPADVVAVKGDAGRLAQVLDNLIQNALEAMPGGGRLTISCEAATTAEGVGVARLIVEDTGAGVPPEDRERIFEPFFTARAAGTGLGLAIAREIIEAHGGRIDLAGREGGGAAFRIELPLAAAAGREEQPGERTGGAE
jgi:signal transduction histidine kinase